MSKEAEIVENVKGKGWCFLCSASHEHGRAALQPSFNGTRETNDHARAISTLSKQSDDNDRQSQQKNVTKRGTKRGIDKAFPEYSESGMKLLFNKDIPVYHVSGKGPRWAEAKFI